MAYDETVAAVAAILAGGQSRMTLRDLLDAADQLGVTAAQILRDAEARNA